MATLHLRPKQKLGVKRLKSLVQAHPYNKSGSGKRILRRKPRGR
jgi:hypothetical protein